jgi:hypothetical protein
VAANELAAQMLRLHQAVLTVEDMGTPGGLGYYLTLVKDRTVADARILGEQSGSTGFGIIGTEAYVINVLRQVELDRVWCPTRAEAMALAEQLEEQAARDRASKVDLAGYAGLAAAERASAQLG